MQLIISNSIAACVQTARRQQLLQARRQHLQVRQTDRLSVVQLDRNSYGVQNASTLLPYARMRSRAIRLVASVCVRTI